METLSEEIWDLVIVGTSLPQALLALSLSRSDLKILHIDQNTYYGGTDAGLSLDEARLWAEKHRDTSGTSCSAAITEQSLPLVKLSASRAYTLSLNPQIVYAQSLFLPSLVSSRINEQLEFLAVGSWWICRDGKLSKVPSSREDVFADEALSRRDKVGLMKLLRSVVQEEAEDAALEEEHDDNQSLLDTLTSRFKLAPRLQAPILSLALEPRSVHDADFESTKSRIKRHMRSMGHFGPGFSAVVAKYAGNAEVAQVACRACAVGGATYLLGHGLSDTDSVNEDGEKLSLTLTSGITIKTKNLVGDTDNLPTRLLQMIQPQPMNPMRICRSVNIISGSFREMFVQTADNGPVPAALIVFVAEDDNDSATRPPIYLQVHSEDTGECPQGQCLIYASTLHPETAEPTGTSRRLMDAVQTFLKSAEESPRETENAVSTPQLLWSMSYISTGVSGSQVSSLPHLQDESGRVMAFPPSLQDIAFNDNLMESVKGIWKKILGNTADESNFMRFEDRSQPEVDPDTQ